MLIKHLQSKESSHSQIKNAVGAYVNIPGKLSRVNLNFKNSRTAFIVSTKTLIHGLGVHHH